MASTIMDNAYNYYLSTYGNSTVSRYDAHKKSDLRTTYNNIVKINKDSPLYKIKESGDVQKFAIDIKENARNIQNIIASLSSNGDGIESTFQQKVASSDQPDIVNAEYVGTGEEGENTDSFELEVKQLASAQTNMGNFLKEDNLNILPGSYSFDLNTNTTSYEFQFNVSDDDTNRSVQDKLEKLIKTANIGLTAEVISNDSNMSSLKIESKQTGLSENESYLFNIVPDGANLSKSAMDTLGIGQISSPASNSSFLLNGTTHSSYSNTFTINNTFELTLNGVSEDDSSANIGFKTNVDAVADNIEALVSSYNSMIQTATNYASTQTDSSRLLSDMSNVAKSYQNNLEPLGLLIADNGSITIDKNLLSESITGDDPEESFSVLNDFKNSLNEKASKASINPMNYVNKIMIAYKNPGHNFATPYVTSIYSGMMLDHYC